MTDLPEYMTCSLMAANGNLDEKWKIAKDHITRVKAFQIAEKPSVIIPLRSGIGPQFLDLK